MIAIHRVNGVVWRYLYFFARSLDRLSDAIYWPVLDLILWGITTEWLSSNGANLSGLLGIMLTAIVFWQIIWRAQYEVCVNLLEEFWSQNLMNLFSSPLQLREWILGVMLVGALKTTLTVAVGVFASWVLYSLNIFRVGYLLVPFMVSLIMFGWCLGFIASGLIVYFGQRIQTLAWTLASLMAPFSAVYYPLSQLPWWGQLIGKCLPTTYVFEGMRAVLSSQRIVFSELVLSFALNAVYLGLSITFFSFMFEKSRAKGLQRME